MSMRRTFPDPNGRELAVVDVRDGFNGRDGIIVAELQAKGYVIAFFKRDKTQDGGIRLDPIARRITDEDVEPETMMAALKWGHSFAETLAEVDR